MEGGAGRQDQFTLMSVFLVCNAVLSCRQADSALKMEAVCSSETLVSACKSTWRYYPEHQHLHRRENLTFHARVFFQIFRFKPIERHHLMSGGISLAAKRLSASHEGLCTVELVIVIKTKNGKLFQELRDRGNQLLSPLLPIKMPTTVTAPDTLRG
jgi:hypothetical protein